MGRGRRIDIKNGETLAFADAEAQRGIPRSMFHLLQFDLLPEWLAGEFFKTTDLIQLQNPTHVLHC